MRHASFAPVVDARTRVLIVGSLPGAASLVAGQYYANPRNQFWRLIGAVIGVDLVSRDYADRLALLLAAGIGLWDVVAEAYRQGSLDSAIRDPGLNGLGALVAMLPDLHTIACNGGTAAALASRHWSGAGLRLLALPSSSPAYTLALASKQAAWAELHSFL